MVCSRRTIPSPPPPHALHGHAKYAAYVALVLHCIWSISLSPAEVQRHFDLRCGYRSINSTVSSRGHSTTARSSYSTISSHGLAPVLEGGGERKLPGAPVGVRTASKEAARSGESARILDDEHARQMLRRALKSAEAAGNYYKINDMVSCHRQCHGNLM